MKKLIILFLLSLAFEMRPQATSNTYTYGVTSNITTTDTTTIIGATASRKNKVTSLTITNASETVGTWVKVLSKTTVIWTGYIVAQGGATVNFPTESPLTCGTNEALRILCETDATETRASASGFKQ